MTDKIVIKTQKAILTYRQNQSFKSDSLKNKSKFIQNLQNEQLFT